MSGSNYMEWGGERNKLKERVMNGVWKNTEEVMDVPE